MKENGIKKLKFTKPNRPALAKPGTVMPPSTAMPCHIAGRPAVLDHGRTVVRPVTRPCLACFTRVVRRFALHGARGFLDPLIFLELAFQVLFSIETR